MPKRESGCGERARSVSGITVTMTAASASPKASEAKKVERQPKATCSTPPITGAIAGTSPMIMPMRASSRPARGPS